METWGSIRKKLEQELLADRLKGRVQYFVTRYRESHDEEGRASIRLDGKEILQGNFYRYDRYDYPVPSDRTVDLGAFDQRAFYDAYWEFNKQSIEESLNSKNLIVRIFAILDRRVGKRRLLQMRETIQNEPRNFQIFYAIRMEAEGLLTEKTISEEECLI